MLCFNLPVFTQNNSQVENALMCYAKAKKLLDERHFNKLDSIISYTNFSSSVFYELKQWDKYLDNLDIKIQVYARKYNKNKVFELIDSAEIVIKENKVNFSRHMASLDYDQGLYYYLNSQFDNSLNYYNKSLKKRIELYGENNLEVANCYMGIGLIYDSKSDYDKALENLNKSLEIRRNILGEENALVAHSISNIGYTYRNKSDLNKALELMLWALDIRKKALGEKSYDVAQSYSSIGVVYYDLCEFEKALLYNSKAVEILKEIVGEKCIDIATLYSAIGAIFKRQSRYAEALEFQEKALSIRREILGEDHLSIAWSYNDIGLIYDHLSDLEKALEYLIKSSEIKKKFLGDKDLDVANSYSNIGTVYNAKGDYDLALEYHNKALSIRHEILGERHPSIAECYNNIGSVYLNKQDYPKALEYFNKDVDINTEILGENHEYVAMGYLNIGSVYDELNQLDKALTCFQKALVISNSIYGDNSEYVAKIYNNIAVLYYKNGDLDNAIVNFKRSIDIKRKFLGFKNSQVCLSYFNIGFVAFENKEYLQALKYGQKAVVSNVINFNDTLNVTTSPTLKGYTDYYTLTYSLLLKATAFEFLADSISQSSIEIDGKILNKIDLYKLSLHNFILCDSVINQKRIKIEKQVDKITLGELANEIYNDALRLTYKLIKLNDAEDDIFKQYLFYFVEQNKSLVLLESIVNAENVRFSEIPDTVQSTLSNLQEQIALYELKIAQADSTEVVQFQNALFDLNRQYNKQISDIKLHYPKYFDLKYSNLQSKLSEIQSVLDNNTALRSYFVGSTNLYIISITKKQVDVWMVDGIDNLLDSIQVYREAITGNPNFANRIHSCGEFLYKNLFPDSTFIYKKLSNLIIIPDGELAFVPFESLPIHSKFGIHGNSVLQDSVRGFKTIGSTRTVGDFSDYPFLIKKFNISYFYSSSLFYQSASTDFKRKKRDDSWFGFAPVFTDSTQHNATIQTLALQQEIKSSMPDSLSVRGSILNGNYVSPLPGSEVEVELIYNAFRNKKKIAKRTVKDDANEKTLKSGILSNYSILHFATHGFVNSDKPELSGIVLAQDTSGGNDGILYAGEMYNLKLNADLTVLSACETGLGRIKRGEGIMGLTRALLYAGTKNIVVSLWPVSDQSTSDLMVNFYENMLGGKKNESYSQWLRDSKLKMISSGKYSHPYYWSPFILIGK